MTLQALLKTISQCRECAAKLPYAPRPFLRAGSTKARLLIIGQAPGLKVHQTGIPWNDPSGDRLRLWLNLTPEQFYDESNVAIMPMGFCYPGKGTSGDLPPRPECAPLWHEKILHYLPNIKLTLLIGQYAQARYLADRRKATLTETVKAWREYTGDGYLPLVHPSPRNGIWLRKNPWFEKDIVPYLQKNVAVTLLPPKTRNQA
ncbi:MAG: uracil-DNA glycosylase family protein [Alphaproteobacteria bacterium]